MSKETFSVLLLSLAALVLPSSVVAQREHLQIDGGWKFHLGDFPNKRSTPVSRWVWQPAASADERFEGLPNHWKEFQPGQEVSNGQYKLVWFKTLLPLLQKSGRSIHFSDGENQAVVYLNGKRLVRHRRGGQPFEVSLDSAWNESGENVLAVLVEPTESTDGMGETTLEAGPPDEVVTQGPAAPDYSDSAWRSLHLPHDFVIEGEFTPKGDVLHGSLLSGVGWYRRTFDLPFSDRGKILWVNFDGVYRDSEVWWNGHFLGRHPSGYIGFRYDLTQYANYGGKNTLVVRADARRFEGWWYEGGGIYRHVWLNKTNPLHLAQDSLRVSSEVTGETARLTLNAGVRQESGEASNYELRAEIINSSGQKKAAFTCRGKINAGEFQTIPSELKLHRPSLWSPQTPNLYTLVLHLSKNGQEIDRLTQTFGVRTVHFDAAQGLFLNGRPVKIQGTCNHQDFAGVGTALPDSLLEWRIRRLKAMGANAYRCAHNPPAPELLDACDRLGMMVMDETRNLGDYSGGAKSPPGTKFEDLADLKAMILRDRNHPSVILWSLCNEEPLQGTPEGGKIFEAMRKLTLSLDPTRPVTAAMNGGWGGGFSLYQDLQGVNYNSNVYDEVHKAQPTVPMFGSETASEVGTRGEYLNDDKRGYLSAYSVNAPSWAEISESAWKAIAQRPFMAGGFVWTGFDYKGEPTPFEWPCINSHFGIMDLCGFPKDAYYYYQSWWGEKPVVHLFPHWNWAGKAGQPIEVWVHSNAEAVELFLNGKSLGTKPMPRLSHLEWKVPYAPGTLEAVGYRGGGKMASDRVETTGKATQIRLSLSDQKRFLTADGEDAKMVTVSLLDAKGRLVSFADNEVTFEVEGAGRLAGVGNGDPSSHERDKADHRKAFHGLCLVVLQAAEKGGSLTLKAASPGLTPARLTLRVQELKQAGNP